ncbi:MFS transporter [Actinokineospora globicatena]|uniref:MFS transporter n=1 Tax=Actinokineospora globicatena TaxID=103729 RepID=UPI0020A265B9|nr:MFS transporter [Actinokineospora globicatena]MCP2306447.1 putative arabinose efflux permease, MFS family [Actinokineospora globicatena]GLW81872.1 MFS transporter [Actinokineospora globicatena]GLW88666.1 MFS transporter [Actinokineospora globicatena]
MRDLLGRGPFTRLWLASLFEEAAEWMAQVALPVYIYQSTGSAGSTALAMVAGLLPTVLLSPVTGVLVDRWDRRKVLLGVCVLQAAALVPLLVGRGPALVIAVLVAQSAIASVFEPTRSAMLPSVVPAARLTAANALMGFNSSVARLAGSALGGIVLGAFGLQWVVVGAVAALAVAAILLVPAMPGTRVVVVRAAVLRQWLTGIAEFGRGPLRTVGVTLVLVSLAQGMFLVLFVVFVTGPLGAGEAEVGLLRGVQAIGGLAAGVALATVVRQAHPGALLGWGGVVFAILSASIWNLPPVSTTIALYIGLFALIGAPAVVATTGSLTLLQSSVPADRTGRVMTTAFAGMAAFQALGMLITGALAPLLPLSVLLNTQAVLLLAAGIVALTGLRKPTRPHEPALV